MSKRRSKKPSTRITTGTKTGKGLDFFPLLPADDPIFKQGWIIGQTFSGASPKNARRRNDNERRDCPQTRGRERVKRDK